MATNQEIKNALNSYFSLGEINTLCFDLGIPYEEIKRDGKVNTITSLIEYTGRTNQTGQLIAYINKARPHANLDPTVPEPIQSDPFNSQPQRGDTIIVQGDYVGGDKLGGDKVGGDKISVGNISNSTVAIGRGASAQTMIGPVPENKDEFTLQLKELKALLEQAIANGEIMQADGNNAAEDLQDVLDETMKESPRGTRIARRLEDVTDVIAAAGKAGSAVLKATPIIAGLIEAAKLIF